MTPEELNQWTTDFEDFQALVVLFFAGSEPRQGTQ